MINITIILIALSISLDAFSLAFAYGLIAKNKNVIIISTLVGVFHFIMPLFGVFLGSIFIYRLPFNSKYIIACIFLFVVVEMFKSIKEKQEKYDLNTYNMILFAFFVSIDSFSIGIGLKFITEQIIESCIIFSIFSASLTYIGFNLGKYISSKVGIISKYIGIIILIFLIMYYLCK